jgi:uncharacterized protein YkwD
MKNINKILVFIFVLFSTSASITTANQTDKKCLQNIKDIQKEATKKCRVITENNIKTHKRTMIKNIQENREKTKINAKVCFKNAKDNQQRKNCNKSARDNNRLFDKEQKIIFKNYKTKENNEKKQCINRARTEAQNAKKDCKKSTKVKNKKPIKKEKTINPPKQTAPITKTNNKKTDTSISAKTSAQAKTMFLLAINNKRTKEQTCGDKKIPKQPPLIWDDKLYEAAMMHSKDMAKHGKLSHYGTDGSSPSQRIKRTGYSGYGMKAENIAAGDKNIVSAMESWMGSSGHCKNIMNPQLSKVAVALVENPKIRYRYFWTMTLGN